MSSIKCFYHASDQDGVCSAAIVLYKYPEAEVYPLNYGDDFKTKVFDIVNKDDTVIMVDFSLDIKKMVKLDRQCKSLIWIDHHYKPIEMAKNMNFSPLGIREDGVAACVLTWRYFFASIEIPIGVDLIGKWDVHDLRDKRAITFYFGMELYELNPKLEIWNAIFSDGEKTFDNVMNTGIILQQYIRKNKNGYARERGFDVDFGDYKALAVNAFVNLDDIVNAGIFDESKYDFLIMFIRMSDGWKFSLRTRREDVNVSDICERFKGGGHKQAAGFETKDEGFVSKMIKGKILIKKNKE